MKKIIFIFILTIGSIYAKPCMTDIYFGNGVWNPDEEETREAVIELRKLMLFGSYARLNASDEGVTFDWKLAYNPSVGTSEDLIETFYQLKESGQISDGYFLGVYAALASESNGEAFITKLSDIISTYNNDASTMFTLYKNSSFDKKKNVLLVAHSQGNLFGNKMYTLMSEAQKKKFRMVSVATPANHVAGYDTGGPYVTASGDYVIRPIPGSLPSNIAGFGHTFLGTYLNIDGEGAIFDGSEHSAKIIALHVKSAYEGLSAKSCGKYWTINMDIKTNGDMNVSAYPIIDGLQVRVAESIGIVHFPLFSSDIKRDSKGNVISVCREIPEKVKMWGDLNLFVGYDDEKRGWKAGTMYSKDTLEARKNISHIIYLRDSNKCMKVSHSGELYELTKDLFE